MWQAQTTHQSIKEYEFDDYIFAYATEISVNTTTEPEDEPEENCMTENVRTINGKTICIKCDRKQKAATVSEKVERKTSNLVHGMENEMVDSFESEKERRKGSWRKCVKGNRRDQVTTRCSYGGKSSTHSQDQMKNGTYSKKAYEHMDKFESWSEQGKRAGAQFGKTPECRNVGTPPQDPPPQDRPPPDRPTFRAFFHSPACLLVSFSLSGGLLVSFSLSGGLLVSFFSIFMGAGKYDNTHGVGIMLNRKWRQKS